MQHADRAAESTCLTLTLKVAARVAEKNFEEEQDMTRRTHLAAKATTTAILAAAVLGAQTAKAEDDNWRVRVGPGHVMFNESASLDVGGAPLPGG